MKIEQLQNLMVSFTAKKQFSQELMAAGFNHVIQIKEQQRKTTALYEQTTAQERPSLDVYRLNREAGGEVVADGGYLLFTAEGQEFVTCCDLVNDLERHGFYLAIAEVFEQESRPDQIKFRLFWSRNSAVQAKLTADQKKLVDKYMAVTWFHCWGFFNPKAVSLLGDADPIQGSIMTLNFSGVMSAKAIGEKISDIRDVHMIDSEGHIRCELRSE